MSFQVVYAQIGQAPPTNKFYEVITFKRIGHDQFLTVFRWGPAKKRSKGGEIQAASHGRPFAEQQVTKKSRSSGYVFEPMSYLFGSGPPVSVARTLTADEIRTHYSGVYVRDGSKSLLSSFLDSVDSDVTHPASVPYKEPEPAPPPSSDNPLWGAFS